jgi:hypothetical protein
MGAFSFATGFFDKLNKDRDRNEENDLKMQSNLMNIWASTTLPMIQKHRAEDDAAVARMNDYMQLEPFQKTPELAFIAAKRVGAGEYKGATDFLEDYQKNPTIVPPDVRQKQLDALARSFSYDIDKDTGKVSNFRLRTQADDSAPLPGAGKDNSVWDSLFGKKAPIDIAQTAREKFKSMTGEDPTSSYAGGGRFNNAPMSGTLDIKPVDRKAEKQEQLAQEVAIRNMDKVRNFGKAFEALQKGPGEFLKYASEPDAFYTREQIQSQEFQQGLKKTFMDFALSDGFNDTNGAIKDILSGNFDPTKLAAKIKSPEERAIAEGKAARIKRAMNPQGDVDWIWLMNQPDLFEFSVPNAEDRKAFNKEFNIYTGNKLATEQIRTLNALGQGAAASIVKPPVTHYGERSVPGGPGPNEPADVGADRRAAEAAKAKEDEVPGAFWQLPTEEESAAETKKETGEEKFKREVADPLSNAAQGVSDTVNSALGKEPIRLGEHPLYKDQYQLDNKLVKAVEDGDEDTISKANPFAVIRLLPAVKNKAKADKIVQSMRFTPADQAKAMDAQFQKSLDFDTYGKFTKSYPSYKEAVANAPAGSLVQINGQLTFITQAAKDALKGK